MWPGLCNVLWEKSERCQNNNWEKIYWIKQKNSGFFFFFLMWLIMTHQKQNQWVSFTQWKVTVVTIYTQIPAQYNTAAWHPCPAGCPWVNMRLLLCNSRKTFLRIQFGELIFWVFLLSLIAENNRKSLLTLIPPLPLVVRTGGITLIHFRNGCNKIKH